MQLESLGRGSGRKSRFTEMGRLEEKNAGINKVALAYPQQITD